MPELTPNLRLPLPHTGHMLSEDVLRLREALTTLDGAVADKAAAHDVLILQAAMAEVLGQPPASLDTLEKLAAALGDDPAFSITLSAQLAEKVDAQTLNTALGAALSGLRQRLYFMGGQ